MEGKEAFALVALGGLGRGELGFGSDLEGRIVLNQETDAPKAVD